MIVKQIETGKDSLKPRQKKSLKIVKQNGTGTGAYLGYSAQWMQETPADKWEKKESSMSEQYL